MTKLLWAGFLAAAAACGGKQSTGGGDDPNMSPMDRAMYDSMHMGEDDGAKFGPLEIGADWKTYVKMNTSPVTSETHGGRLVDTYVNHWAEPPAAWAKKLGGPIYWRTPSKRAAYCWECHENYDRALGGVPAPQRISEIPR
jgi:hypothetical protein